MFCDIWSFTKRKFIGKKRELLLWKCWGIFLSIFKYTFIIVPCQQYTGKSVTQSVLSPFPAIPSILWPALFKEQLIHLFTQFKDKIQCIHTWSAFEWGDLAFHTGPIFWSGSLSPSCQLLLKSRQSFSKEDSGNCLSETNNCGRIEVPRLITSVGALPLLTGSIAVSTGATKDLSWTFAGNHQRKVFRQSPFSFQIWMSRLQCAEYNYFFVWVHFPEKQKPSGTG